MSEPRTEATALAAALREAADKLETLSGWVVVRNQVGNLSLLDPQGNYAGYIDVLTGELALFDEGQR